MVLFSTMNSNSCKYIIKMFTTYFMSMIIYFIKNFDKETKNIITHRRTYNTSLQMSYS